MNISDKAPSVPPPQRQAQLTLRSIDGEVLWVSQRHLIRAIYTWADGAPIVGHPVTWQIVPSDKVQFSASTTNTDSNGVAANELLCSTTFSDILLPATITAHAFNSNIDVNDVGHLAVILSKESVSN